MRSQRAMSILVFAFVGCLSCVACSEGELTSTVLVPATPEFIEALPPAGVTDHLVSFRKGAVDGGRILLDAVVTEVDEPITGIAMKLSYPENFSRFVSCTRGNLFSSEVPCVAQESAPGSGEVFIGRSVSESEATPVVGERVIAQLEFLVFGDGSGPLIFESQNFGGSDASALLDVNGDPIFVHWVSGTLVGESLP